MIIDTDEWVSLPEYARRVGTIPQNLRYYMRNGSLNPIRLGNDWHLHIDELKKWPFKKKKAGGRKKS